MIGRLPYYYFLLLTATGQDEETDWKSAVFILPFTLTGFKITIVRLEDCRILLPSPKRLENMRWKLEYCRITTSFYSF